MSTAQQRLHALVNLRTINVVGYVAETPWEDKLYPPDILLKKSLNIGSV